MGAHPDIRTAIAATAAITGRQDATTAAAVIIMTVTVMGTAAMVAVDTVMGDTVMAVTATADMAAAGTAMAMIPTTAAGDITGTAGRIMAPGTAMVIAAGGATTTTDDTTATGGPSPIAAINAGAGHTASRESNRARNRPAEEGVSADRSLLALPTPESVGNARYTSSGMKL